MTSPAQWKRLRRSLGHGRWVKARLVLPKEPPEVPITVADGPYELHIEGHRAWLLPDMEPVANGGVLLMSRPNVSRSLPRAKRHSERVTLRLRPGQRAQLQRLADEAGIAAGAFARDLVVSALDALEGR